MYNYKYLTIGKKYNPEKYILAEFYLESSLDFNQAAAALASESSIGTWTEVGTLEAVKFEKLAARVYWMSAKEKKVKVAYPLALFEPGNIAQLLSSVAGNIYSLKEIKKLRLLNLDFPEKYINSFAGPAFGLKGVRKITGIKKRPLIGVIVKPKMGLSASAHAKVAALVLKNGADLVKDDENLTSQKFNPFKERVAKTLKAVKQIEKKTKTRKLIAFNVTAETGEMIKRAKFVKAKGGRCVMIDIVTAGFSAVQALRRANLGLIIHGHRAMHSAFTRSKDYGLDFIVLAKLCRLAGIDQLHAGTAVGKMEGGRGEVLKNIQFLKSRFGRLKPVLPVASGGLHPGLVPALVKIIGLEAIINFGGGLHGHPAGSGEGAKAAFQAVESVLKKVEINKYAESNPSLKKALKHFS